MAKRAEKQNTDPVQQYALDVVSGKEIAGPLVRAAGERHLRDLKDGKKRGLVWDFAAAERVFGYFREVLTLVDDEGNVGPFKLHSSQQFIVGSLFGWKNRDGSRRFRVAYVEQGKGCGKSPTAAGIGLYMLTGDGESQAQVFAAAVDRDQAKVPFQFAVSMVDRSPLLSANVMKSGGKFGDITKVYNLSHAKSGSYFKPIASESTGKGKSGFLPHCVIVDELHEHPTDAMVEYVRKNTKGRRQPLVLMITNSGVYDPTSVCWRYHDYSDQIVNGAVKDDEFFSYVCGLDEVDDYRDKSVWKKAVPLLGVSLPERYLEQQVREAEGMPSKQSLTRRLNFCEWVESADPWITKELWEANCGFVDAAMLRGQKCYGAIDLSKRGDLTALVLVFPQPDDSRDVLVFAWTPAEGLRDRAHQDKAPYPQWVNEGFLITTPGAIIDYAFVAQKIGELSTQYKIESLAFDQWHFDEMDAALNAVGVTVPCVKHQQGFVGMNPAIEVTEQDFRMKRFRHGGNPVLRSCVFNCRIEKNASALRAFEKKKTTGRIDAAVALAMADNLASAQVEQVPEFQVMFV